MSVRVMSLVWAIDLPDSQKIVLLALADCANDEGHCWPSMATLAKKCSKGERTVQGVIKELVAAGHLGRKEVPGKGCQYLVHPRSSCTPAVAAPPQGLRDTPAEAADKPSRTIIGKEAKASSPKGAHDPFPMLPCTNPETWADFLTNRKRKNLPNTATAHRKLCRDLDAMVARTGWPPGEVFEACVAKGWGAIYDPRDDGNGRNNANTPGKGASGVARALDRRLGLGEFAGEAGRPPTGIGQADSRGTLAIAPPVR